MILSFKMLTNAIKCWLMLTNAIECWLMLANVNCNNNKSRKFVIHLHSMTAENIYSIAIHLPEKELEKLYTMLGNKVNTIPKLKKTKTKLITDKEAINYLLKNVF